MRLERSEGQICVVLSRRNLLTLLAKLAGHPSDSACSVMWREPGATLLVHAEADALHYGQRVEPPGPMHPDTEAWVAEHLL